MLAQEVTSLAGISSLFAQGPDPLLDAGLLATLVGVATPAALRLQALSQLLEAHLSRHPTVEDAPALPLFHTVAHAALLEVLVSHARALCDGAFKGSNGAPCRTLVGARGIGKTTMMRAFALVAASAFPGLLPVYLSGQGLLMPTHALQRAHLPALLGAIAAREGLAFDAVTLYSPGKRLLLLVDEFDDLYRAPPSEPVLAHNVLATLEALKSLGDRTAGNSSVLLCGSSSSTYRLVQGDVRQWDDRFPLALGGIPDLNSTKFSRLRIPTSPCNATHEVAGMLEAVAQGGGEAAAALPPSAVTA